tara:strand:- start:1776 stop:2042 length:267 start_codon:yes stop_codon:yes gene_type:complete
MATGTLEANGNGDWTNIGDGKALITVSGTWGGGTAKIQLQQADGTALDVNGASWTANIASQLEFGAPARLRVNLASATSPDLDWEIRG